jgi:cell division protein FtsN
MTRDYAKKSTKRSPQRSSSRGNAKRRSTKKAQQSPPGWLWLLAGVLLGVLIMSLTKLSDMPSEQDTDAVNDDSSAESSGENDTKPRFDFYTLLRESEVIVPDTPDTDGSSALPTTNDIFLLQVGSFKSNRDADSLRARLLLLNLNARIEKVRPRKNETWHRVLVGPFSDRSELADARGKLASNGIDSLLLKRKK